jgi:UDPglucose 6-dehydrogenase
VKLCVLGLWHLGTVTAACMASAGHRVTGLEFDPETVRRLRDGSPPVFEPGLEELIGHGLASGNLSFTADPEVALRSAEAVWVAYDTPVDEEDRADVGFVVERAERLFPYLSEGTLVLVSSQLPVGTTRRLERSYAAAFPGKPVAFACLPENLRLGKAIEAFLRPDRVVAGVRSDADRARIASLLRPVTDRIEWMSVESAEMTKHALNAFLATSVTFANEVAVLCEGVGADAKEVERGLKTEARVGPGAYLSPGAAFAGGTLARDVAFLARIGGGQGRPTRLLSAVKESNDAHKSWPLNALHGLLGELKGRTVAVWGLTYKPGTDTLRRSGSVELCRHLAEEGARVRAHDPAIQALPPEEARFIDLCPTPESALPGAAALVVATEWPEYRAIGAASLLEAMPSPVVVDANRFLRGTLGADPRVRYAAVGKGFR